MQDTLLPPIEWPRPDGLFKHLLQTILFLWWKDWLVELLDIVNITTPQWLLHDSPKLPQLLTPHLTRQVVWASSLQWPENRPLLLIAYTLILNTTIHDVYLVILVTVEQYNVTDEILKKFVWQLFLLAKNARAGSIWLIKRFSALLS